jgi:hypothetical protein
VKYGYLVFDEQKLGITEYDLITLIKITKQRNKRLYEKLVNYYKVLFEKESDSPFEELFNELVGKK